MPDIAGLKLIVPTSVSAGGSATATLTGGKVTFTNVKNTDVVSVEGVWSATYDNYLMVCTLKGLNVLSLRLRVGGSDASGTNYTRQQLRAGSTTVAGSRVTSGTEFRALEAFDSTLKSGTHVYMYGPYLAQPTASRTVTVQNEPQIIDYAQTHSLSTSYTGFTVFSNSTDLLSGTIQIYGLSQ